MSAAVKLRAKLPAHEDNNGLDFIIEDLLETPETVRCAFVWLDVYRVVEDVATGERHVVIELRKVEPLGAAKDVPGSIREAVVELAEKRLGKQPLPFDQIEPDEVTVTNVDDAEEPQ